MSPAATPHPMTLDRERTALVVIDVQERLFPPWTLTIARK